MNSGSTTTMVLTTGGATNPDKITIEEVEREFNIVPFDSSNVKQWEFIMGSILSETELISDMKIQMNQNIKKRRLQLLNKSIANDMLKQSEMFEKANDPEMAMYYQILANQPGSNLFSSEPKNEEVSPITKYKDRLEKQAEYANHAEKMVIDYDIDGLSSDMLMKPDKLRDFVQAQCVALLMLHRQYRQYLLSENTQITEQNWWFFSKTVAKEENIHDIENKKEITDKIQIILNNLNKLQACIPATKNIIDQFMYDNTGNQKVYFRKKENVVIKNTATPLSPPFTPPSSPPSTITMIKSWMGGGDTSKSDNYSDIPVATAIEGDDNLGSVQWGDVFF